jgi:DNA-binding CsgD family transcriptional regulator
MFSKAESMVITYLEQGYSNYDIGHKLCVCEKTVKFHLTNIYKKAGVKSRTELMAHRMGLTTEREAIMKDKINFIDQKFQVGNTIQHLHSMMKEVTKEEINPSTVNAACNCVARLNETINTAIQAARFLNER